MKLEFWNYVKEIFTAAFSSAEEASAIIEILLCFGILFLPKLFGKPKGSIEHEKSLRKIFVWKFRTNTEWRIAVVVLFFFSFHFLILSPFEVYKKTQEQFPKIENFIQWQPPEISQYTPNVQILFGGHFEDLGGIKYFGNPVFLDVQKLRDKPVVVPLGYAAATVSIIKNRIFMNLDVPTKGKPIQIRQGESVEPLPAGWYWNCDSDMLEIVDDQDQAVFQEESVTNGIWIRGAVQTDRQVSYASWTAQIDNVPRVAFNPSDNQLTKAFLYPSSKFQGKRIPK